MKRLISFETALRQRATARTRLKFAEPVGDPRNNTEYSTCRRCGYHVCTPACSRAWPVRYMGQHLPLPDGARVVSWVHDEVIIELPKIAELDFIAVTFTVDPPPCL